MVVWNSEIVVIEKAFGRRVLVLILSLLVWYVALNYIKMPLVKIMRLYTPELSGGPRLFMDHLLVYSLMPALICGIFWWLLAKRGHSEPLSLKVHLKRAFIDAFWAALLIVALTLPLAIYRWGFQPDFHPDFWKFAGNLFSNTYEEIQYRGLILLAGLYAFRNKHLANLLSALAFAYSHTEYPLEIKIYIVLVGCILGWAYLRTMNFTAPVLAHCLSDWVLDSILMA